MKTEHKILLVEDDPDDIELLKQAFNDHNLKFNFDVITEGNKVLPYLELCNKIPDVVVLDLNLPKMHGKEILEIIKSKDSYKNMPVVVLTTSSAQTDIDFCIETGASLYLIKPVTMTGYSDVVTSIVNLANSNKSFTKL